MQSMNSKIADFCSFSLFTCFCPRAKQLQPPTGWCSGSGGSLAAPAHSPREQNSSCLAVTPDHEPPLDLLTAWSSAPASISRALCSPAFTAVPLGCAGRKDGIKLDSSAAIPDSVQKLLSKVLCVSPMSPLKPAEPLGPCWVIPVVGAWETGGFGNLQSRAPPELCCQLWSHWNPSSSCRPCRAMLGTLGQLQFHPWPLGSEAKLRMELGQNKPSAPACSGG